uniref:Uncharacterized protein n=2 Tax=Araucaria cunninghamii TaxID=56994 RepID=A0A0D6QVY6_ARACU
MALHPCNVGLYKVTATGNSVLMIERASSFELCGSKTRRSKSFKSSTSNMFHAKFGTSCDEIYASLDIDSHFKGRNISFYRKKLSKKIMQSCGKSRASVLPENTISSNKPKLVFLEPSLLSTAILPKQISTFQRRKNRIEASIQKAVFDCRFFTLLAVAGTLAGSLLCFITGCSFVWESFSHYFHGIWKGLDFAQTILPLLEAIDVFLVGTVMLIFGMGLYELFIGSLHVPGYGHTQGPQNQTEPQRGFPLCGPFCLKERPSWLQIESVGELKTKVGRVLMMILLPSLLEKSKMVPMTTGLDLLCFLATILLSSSSIFLLSRLSEK